MVNPTINVNTKILIWHHSIMLTIDCRDVPAIKNELVVYVSDQVAAIPTLKNHQFTLSTLDDDDENEVIDTGTVITAIKEFLDSIGEGHNFAVISNGDKVNITSISGKTIDREASGTSMPGQEMLSCTHCGFVTRYKIELEIHMRIHYF